MDLPSAIADKLPLGAKAKLEGLVRLEGGSAEALEESLKQLADEDGGWISEAEATRLFGTGDEGSPDSRQPKVLLALAQFASAVGFRVQVEHDLVRFTRASGVP